MFIEKPLVHGMLWLLVVLFLAPLFGCAAKSAGSGPMASPKPPMAERRPKISVNFDKKRVDYYYWLRERDNSQVIDYLNAENEYTAAMTAHTEKLRDRLFDEMVGRIKETDRSVPVFHKGFYYYTRTEQGKQYRIHCRKKGSLDAPEQVTLDENVLAEGHEYFELGGSAISDDQNLLAYAIDTEGDETYDIRVKDLRTGKLLTDRIDNTRPEIVWAANNATFFYSLMDKARRPYKLMRHELGTGSDQDALVYHEKDESYFLSVDKTRDDRYIMLSLNSNITAEVRFLDAATPTGKFAVVEPRSKGVEYYAAHHDDNFYILTNADGAVNFKLVKAPVTAPGKANWSEVIAARGNVKLEDIDLFRDYLVVWERELGLMHIRVQPFDPELTELQVEFPEPVYTVRSGANPSFDTMDLRFHYSSMVTPDTVVDYDMTAGTWNRRKVEEVTGYDAGLYETKRIWAKAPDGVEVPMSMVYKKGTPLDGTAPLFLYGYGSYGITIDPRFSSSRVSLLDRGMIFVIAHVRGGGMLGRPWYEDGKLLHKKNTFTDFIACAEKLIADKYTTADRMAIAGASAGGLLIGAVINMRPELFEVAVADVPFVDVVNTMLDPTIPLTVIEYDEWGNPNKQKFFEYMLSYSPYDQVKAQQYPHLLITAGLNDPRVQYWEPAKFTAKLRYTKTDNHTLLLKTEMEAGHFGSSGRYDYLKDIAFMYAFVLDHLGIGE